MPPTRTLPYSKKVTKTQRSPSENTERAFIAASRRSDRSLEARVESARKASEVHKERTGRALRVTEEDVANEEMYEEEDDGFSSRFRRMMMAGQFHPESAEMHRRWAALLTTQLETRGLPQLSVNQPHASAPQYGQPMSPPPISAHQQQQSPQLSDYLHNPYPIQGIQPGFSLYPHQRTASIPQPSRYSPGQSSPAMNPQQTRSLSHPGPSTTGMYPGTSSSHQSQHPNGVVPEEFPSTAHYGSGVSSSTTNPSSFFTTQLPAETQAFLNWPVNPNATDLGVNKNHGSQNPVQQTSDHNTVRPTGQFQQHTFAGNLNSTLTLPEVTDIEQTSYEDAFGDTGNMNENFSEPSMFYENGTGTPFDWGSYVEDSEWAAPTASQ